MANGSDAAAVHAKKQQTLELVEELVLSFEDRGDEPPWDSSMAFAYGGRIPIHVATHAALQSLRASGGATTCQPVILRWDPSSEPVSASTCKLQFPLDQSDSRSRHNLEQLLKDMQPATIGYEVWEDQNDMDGYSHKTYNLDASKFACTFSPHELGIVDDIARVLLPGPKSQEVDIKRKSVLTAELEKLNVYAGPSGHFKFKAHVETSREDYWAPEYIGSLVVCLPSIHEGGQLEVRYQGRKATFDWSMAETARPEIQWAAFHVDCESAVLPVTSGHLITLTYNLYESSIPTTPPKAGNGLIDATQLPPYEILHKLLLQDNFMPDGGWIGVHTSYAYPHASCMSGLPSTLKGTDMVAWETFRSLGFDVRLRPVVEAPEFPTGEWSPADLTYKPSEGSHSDTDDGVPSMSQSDSGNKKARLEEEEPNRAGGGDIVMGDGDRRLIQFELPMRPQIRHGDSVAGSKNMADPKKDNDGDCPMAEGSQVPHTSSNSGPWEVDEEEIQALQKESEELQSLPSSYFTGAQPACPLLPRNEHDGDEDEDEDEEITAFRLEQHGVQARNLALGNDLSFHTETKLVKDEVDMMEMLDRWIEQMQEGVGQEPTTQQPLCLDYDEQVAWLNRPGQHKEPQISYAVYGDDGEAKAATIYSFCGIIAHVPRFSARRALFGKK
ncbi:hypothetical protein KVR01_011602 [Diaporthe batatas]|uniref:uncharacterized protein n=1 Tax=Diaporthe batatas TaxID=748121 RepID=UPI001D041DF8|nr:uncharacterized protein KVR01_011602 [Diaporthe batatas]KAG8158480.1 hypothetical protein KVR01_011602 [Diaporthe batatas]